MNYREYAKIVTFLFIYKFYIYINMSKIEPIQIKRVKNSKFTEKRNPYKKYQKAKWEWSDIF